MPHNFILTIKYADGPIGVIGGKEPSIPVSYVVDDAEQCFVSLWFEGKTRHGNGAEH